MSRLAPVRVTLVLRICKTCGRSGYDVTAAFVCADGIGCHGKASRIRRGV